MTKDYKDDILHLNTQDRKREREKRENRERSVCMCVRDNR